MAFACLTATSGTRLRVDFYQVSRDPAEAVLALLARNTLAAGERLLVVSEDAAVLDRVGPALWDRPGEFLANGRVGGPDDARQPILLSGTIDPANGARFVALADGVWREEALGFDRAFLLFDEATLQSARETWKKLAAHDGLERHFWKQDGGKWVKAG